LFFGLYDKKKNVSVKIFASLLIHINLKTFKDNNKNGQEWKDFQMNESAEDIVHKGTEIMLEKTFFSAKA